MEDRRLVDGLRVKGMATAVVLKNHSAEGAGPACRMFSLRELAFLNLKMLEQARKACQVPTGHNGRRAVMNFWLCASEAQLGIFTDFADKCGSLVKEECLERLRNIRPCGVRHRNTNTC